MHYDVEKQLESSEQRLSLFSVERESDSPFLTVMQQYNLSILIVFPAFDPYANHGSPSTVSAVVRRLWPHWRLCSRFTTTPPLPSTSWMK